MARIEIHLCLTPEDRQDLARLCAVLNRPPIQGQHTLLARIEERVYGYLAFDLVRGGDAHLTALECIPVASDENRTHMLSGLLRYALEMLLDVDCLTLAITPRLCAPHHGQRLADGTELLFPEQLFPEHLVRYAAPQVYRLLDQGAYTRLRLPRLGQDTRYLILSHGDLLTPRGMSFMLVDGCLELMPSKVSFEPFQPRRRLVNGHPWDGTASAVSIGVCHLVSTNDLGQPAFTESPFSISLYNCYVLAHVLTAAHELGFFDFVGRDGNRIFGYEETAKALAMDQAIFEGMTPYLEGAELIVKRADGFSIQPQKIAEAVKDIHFLNYIVRGYGDVLKQTAALARGNKRYGIDVRRHEPGVAQFSPAVKHTVGRAIRETLDLVPFRKLAYPRCGPGARLVNICREHPDIQAIGIDLDPEICHRARNAVREAGMSDRVTILQEDAFTWMANSHPDVDMVLLAGGIIHDILHMPGGRDLLLRRLKRNLAPDSWVLVQDMNITGRSEPDFPLSVCDGFAFVHNLMGVPLHRREDYVAMFRKTGWQLLGTFYAGLPNTWIYLLKP